MSIHSNQNRRRDRGEEAGLAASTFLNGATPARQLMATAALFSVLGMAAGLNALAGGRAWVWTLPAALLLLRLQFLIAKATSAGGQVTRLARVIYFVLMVLAMCLAVAAVAEQTAAGRIAQKGFERSTAQIAPQIEKVESSFTATAESLDSLALYSHNTAETEFRDGNTCAVSTDGDGPFRRRRQSDEHILAEAASGFRAKAKALHDAKARADAAVATYTVARHAQVAAAVNEALDAARVATQSGALGGLEADLRKLLDDNVNGSIDALTHQRVTCIDPTLTKRLTSLLATPKPPVPVAAPLPLSPNHETVIRGLIAHLAAVAHGDEPFDWEVYGFALLGIVPELSLIVGMLWRKVEMRDRHGPVAGVAMAHGLDPDDDPSATLQAAAAAAAEDPLLAQLGALLVRDTSLLGWVEYLRIPVDEAHRDLELIAQSLVRQGRLVDRGVWPAGAAWARFRPAPPDPEAPAHFFQLTAEAWRDLQLEALRRAADRSGGQRGPILHAAE
jgi:hypothetical protein